MTIRRWNSDAYQARTASLSSPKPSNLFCQNKSFRQIQWFKQSMLTFGKVWLIGGGLGKGQLLGRKSQAEYQPRSHLYACAAWSAVVWYACRRWDLDVDRALSAIEGFSRDLEDWLTNIVLEAWNQVLNLVTTSLT